MSTEAKVARLDDQKDVKDTKKKKNYWPKRKLCLEIGLSGFLVTCNFRAKNCIREAYNLLNNYATQVYGEEDDDDKSDSGDEDVDISDKLKKECDKLRAQLIKTDRGRRFQVVGTGANNFLFIRTVPPINPVELGERIATDIAENRLKMTQHLMRLVPVEAVCHVNDVVATAGKLADKHFLSQSCTFSIAYNKRFNNVLKRDDIVHELADLIKSKNIGNRVDLTNPEKTLVVEILKGLCLLSVVKRYNEYKKYNLSELASGPKVFSEEKLKRYKNAVDVKTKSEETTKPAMTEIEKEPADDNKPEIENDNTKEEVSDGGA